MMEAEDTRAHNLLFLLSVAPLCVGCAVVSDDADTDATTTGQSTGGATESVTSGTTEQATGETTEGTTGGTVTTIDTNDTIDTCNTDCHDDGDTCNTGCDYSEICYAYGELVLECQMSEELGLEAREYCEYLLDEYYAVGGAECQAAFETFVACLNALSCVELTMVFDTPDDQPLPFCDAEHMAIDAACVPA